MGTSREDLSLWVVHVNCGLLFFAKPLVPLAGCASAFPSCSRKAARARGSKGSKQSRQSRGEHAREPKTVRLTHENRVLSGQASWFHFEGHPSTCRMLISLLLELYCFLPELTPKGFHSGFMAAFTSCRHPELCYSQNSEAAER